MLKRYRPEDVEGHGADEHGDDGRPGPRDPDKRPRLERVYDRQVPTARVGSFSRVIMERRRGTSQMKDTVKFMSCV